ncbi:hypothetical protein Lysil_0547 [Lysobacter silvestris]|uniref:Thioredoxin domain-containing protein n=2 Tax=Solilutibacter silvestris TaxID=1645665 RepID=A0A2K1Q1J3_9GAMM|nr:hypothetical protein Lysil_0547 [Lysobacter silvestris]
MLLVLAALFLGSFALAGALRFSGWRPQGLKNKGELLNPPVDLRDVSLRLADGAAYPWSPEARRWRILAVPAVDCRERCDKLARDLDVAWQALGHDRDHADVLWAGAVPASAPATSHPRAVVPLDVLKVRLPRAGAPADAVVYVIDPNGFVVLRYAPGFDPADLRTDLSRLLKLQ